MISGYRHFIYSNILHNNDSYSFSVKLFVFWLCLKLLFSLHIRSMSETICDALPHSSYQILAARICVQNSLSAPTQIFQKCWSGVPPPPTRKLKCGQILALWVWVGPHPVSGSSYVETNFCIPVDTISFPSYSQSCSLNNYTQTPMFQESNVMLTFFRKEATPQAIVNSLERAPTYYSAWKWKKLDQRERIPSEPPLDLPLRKFLL